MSNIKKITKESDIVDVVITYNGSNVTEIVNPKSAFAHLDYNEQLEIFNSLIYSLLTR